MAKCKSWSDAAECGIWSGSTMFAKAYQSQYLGLLWYAEVEHCIWSEDILSANYPADYRHINRQ